MIGNTVTKTKEYKCTIKELWYALTNPDALKDWFFEVKGFELVQGDVFEFYAGKYLHECEIKDIFLYHKLIFSWRYPIYPGESTVTFILNPINDGEKTQLELIHDGIATFPANDPYFSYASFEAGWEEVLEIALREYVEYKE
ncbi:SRPBCC domain-containing protein [Faecalibacter sp. LW9]|uniref:SRPBCC family protein n=1 Tax=Faecalibacter sp. LW9 TaxID=3103144 RepID=UPI002AFEE12B|nr:SRPBCC domain-containing protein [Faecalibacter sp. LW9]